MPGRFTPPMPERLSPQWAMSALTSVPESWPAAGMDDEPGRLVDDDEVVVLVDDGEFDRFACGSAGDRRRHRQRDPRSACDLAARVEHRHAVDGHLALPDQRLQAAARQIALQPRQHPVEPLGPQGVVQVPFQSGRLVHRILVPIWPFAFFSKRA